MSENSRPSENRFAIVMKIVAERRQKQRAENPDRSLLEGWEWLNNKRDLPGPHFAQSHIFQGSRKE